MNPAGIESRGAVGSGRPSVLVIGGGLAGIAASLRLAQAGWQVTLLEARRELGGRVFSFESPVDGRRLDNGQHVIVGACRTLLQFLEEIGARRLWHLQRRLDVAVYDASGRRGMLYGVALPSPLYLLPAFVGYPHLGWMDKAKAVRALFSIMLTDRENPELEDMTFHQWLRQRGQSERVMSNLWNVLIEGTLNDNIRDVSAAMGLMVVQDGLLAGSNTANVGYPTVPLSDALANPARSRLQELGVRIITGCPVRRMLTRCGGQVDGIVAGDDRVMCADAYVSAVPFWTLNSILPAPLAHGRLSDQLSNLRTSPIVNVHLLYDRQVMTGDFCYFLDSPLQWVFNSTRIFGPAGVDGSQSLSVSISAAWDFIHRDRSELAEMIAAEMSAAFPNARDARLLDATVVKQPNATIRCIPGSGHHRPGPVTDLPNLFLAGEWTDTGWPSTMEGAVISGYNAAEAVMSAASGSVCLRLVPMIPSRL